jgi:BirA family biotin operon repressor/biotin-[acetyl-CoA-carboxylase] ligase
MSRDPTTQTNVRRHRLLALLSDGAFHSGEKLAKRLRISRGGIWKIISTLREFGIEVQSVPRQGYRLPRAVDLYDKAQILEAASAQTQQALVRTDVLLTVDSTNRFVTDIDESLDAGCAQLCVAELQNAGRGRRGRSWMAPFGAGICMSVGWQFAEAPPTFSALSLAVGVAVVSALRRLGAAEVGLKWPNDVLWKGRKLGGILIEMRGESAGPAHVVIGIGINMRMPTAIRLLLAEQQAAVIADVYEIMRERSPNRNVLVGAIVDELVRMLKTFAKEGFAPYQSAWRDLDALANAPVRVINGAQTTQGLARGVDSDGTLLVDVDGEIRKFVSGEVSLRAVQGK